MVQSERIIHPSVLTGRFVSLLVDDLDRELEQAIKNRDTHVHRIRVDIKKLRAWIRLVQDSPCSLDLKKTDLYLKNTAKIFSYHRDAEIIPETVSWLKKKLEKSETGDDLDKISRHIKYKKTSLILPDEQSEVINKKLFSELKQKSIKVNIEYIIEHGLKATYKKALREGKKAYSSQGSLNDLHRFRKWVKYLCYQIEFIQASYPDYYQDEQKLLDKLGKQLGRIHDLDILCRKVNEVKEKKALYVEAYNAIGLIKKHMKKIHKRTHALFDKAFHCSPRKFSEKRTS